MAANPAERPDERSALLPSSSNNGNRHDNTFFENAKRLPDADAANQSATSLEPSPNEPRRSSLQTSLIMSGFWIAGLLYAIDSTLVSTLGAPIATSFNSLTRVSWIGSAFFVANVVSQPLAGKLSDIFGRYAVMVVSLMLFGAGNIICAVAGSANIFILGRAVAGLGGGAVGPLLTTVASDLVPLRSRGVWQGLANVVFGVGSTLGALFGGVINDTLGWRWAFWIQAPPTLLALLLGYCFPPPSPTDPSESGGLRSKIRRVDIAGACLLAVALILLMLGMTVGGVLLPWSHPVVLASWPSVAALFVAFSYYEKRVPEPLIPLGLLWNRTVFSAYSCLFFTTIARTGVLFFAPIFLHIQGYSTAEAGFRFVPASIAVGLGFMGTGLLVRMTSQYYVLTLGIAIIHGLSLISTALFTNHTPSWIPYVSLFVLNGTYAGLLTTTVLAFTAAVDSGQQAVVASATFTVRSIGSAVSIPLASVVFQNVLRHQLWARLGQMPSADTLLPEVLDNVKAIKMLPWLWQQDARQSYIYSLQLVFSVTTAAGVIGAIATAFMQEHRLYATLSRTDEN